LEENSVALEEMFTRADPGSFVGRVILRVIGYWFLWRAGILWVDSRQALDIRPWTYLADGGKVYFKGQALSMIALFLGAGWGCFWCSFFWWALNLSYALILFAIAIICAAITCAITVAQSTTQVAVAVAVAAAPAPNKLIATVVSASHLIAKDFSIFGSNSDPFVTLTLMGQTGKTMVIEDNVNPQWHEMFIFRAQAGATLDVLVQDQDKKSAEFLGRCSIPLVIGETVAWNKWYPLEGNPNKDSGHIQLKLDFVYDPSSDLQVTGVVGTNTKKLVL
jgi:hypothetical protein